MRHWRGTRPHLRWAGAALVPLMIGRYPETATLTAAVSISVLVLALVVAAVSIGAAFGRSAERRRACLQTLQTLLRLVPWMGKR